MKKDADPGEETASYNAALPETGRFPRGTGKRSVAQVVTLRAVIS